MQSQYLLSRICVLSRGVSCLESSLLEKDHCIINVSLDILTRCPKQGSEAKLVRNIRICTIFHKQLNNCHLQTYIGTAMIETVKARLHLIVTVTHILFFWPITGMSHT